MVYVQLLLLNEIILTYIVVASSVLTDGVALPYCQDNPIETDLRLLPSISIYVKWYYDPVYMNDFILLYNATSARIIGNMLCQRYR